MLEALRQYHLTDRVSSTITLEENDERTLSAVERCKMKGRRVSVGICHQTLVMDHHYLVDRFVELITALDLCIWFFKWTHDIAIKL